MSAIVVLLFAGICRIRLSCPENVKYDHCNFSKFLGHLLISGVVIRDVTNCYFVLFSAFLHVVLTFGHLVLQLPNLLKSVQN